MKNLIANSQATGRLFHRRDPLASIFWLLGIFFVSQIAAGVAIALYPAFKDWTSAQSTYWLNTSIWAQFVYILLAEIFAVWLVLKVLKRISVSRQRIGLVKPQLKDIVRALAGYVAYFLFYLILIAIAANLTQIIDVEQPQQIGFEAARGGTDLALVFLALVVLPPVAEEIMFRGFLFTSLRAKYRFHAAAVITSLLFGVAHLQFSGDAPLLWIAAIDTFSLSYVLCYLREKTGSLWSPVFLHALKNGIAFIILFHDRF